MDKEYTPVRRFYALVGFISLWVLIGYVLFYLVTPLMK